MKAVILAGGQGSRISEESHLKPKPMIEIGGKPILWHIMKIYSQHGIKDFIICAGYKGYVLKEYFQNYFLHNSDVTFDLSANQVKIHQSKAEPWSVTVVDTGESTMTGGRLKRIARFIEDNEDFCFTYGDGVADIDVSALIKFHREQKRISTVTATKPPGRFGAIEHDGTRVTSFLEKPQGDGAYINAGFFVLNSKAISYVKNDESIWEREPMENLARDGQMSVYFHNKFWHAMDTLRDKTYLDDLVRQKKAPWVNWLE